MVVPLTGLLFGLRIPRRRVSRGDRIRRKRAGRIQTVTHRDGANVAHDGDASQHRVLRLITAIADLRQIRDRTVRSRAGDSAENGIDYLHYLLTRFVNRSIP